MFFAASPVLSVWPPTSSFRPGLSFIILTIWPQASDDTAVSSALKSWSMPSNDTSWPTTTLASRFSSLILPSRNTMHFSSPPAFG